MLAPPLCFLNSRVDCRGLTGAEPILGASPLFLLSFESTPQAMKQWSFALKLSKVDLEQRDDRISPWQVDCFKGRHQTGHKACRILKHINIAERTGCGSEIVKTKERSHFQIVASPPQSIVSKHAFNKCFLETWKALLPWILCHCSADTREDCSRSASGRTITCRGKPVMQSLATRPPLLFVAISFYQPVLDFTFAPHLRLILLLFTLFSVPVKSVGHSISKAFLAWLSG
jgi:hypothetical protein